MALLWKQRQDIGPSPQWFAPASYDAVRHQTVLLAYAPAETSETWIWDGELWTQVADTGPASFQSGMAYDRSRDRTVAYRGSETWEWDGGTWTQVADTGPLGDSPLVYHDARKRVVRLGAITPAGSHETWEWDGSDWLQRADTGPSGRSGFAMAPDLARGVVILHGGLDSQGGAALDDTWTWDGDLWQKVADVGPARGYHGMVGDVERSRIVAFGGVITHVTPTVVNYEGFKDTWEWDGKHWKQVQDIGPNARIGHAMAYDETRYRTVLFGGAEEENLHFFSDTWELGEF